MDLLSKEFENDSANELSATDSDMPELESNIESDSDMLELESNIDSDSEYEPSIEELSDFSEEDLKETESSLDIFQKIYTENSKLWKQNEELKLQKKNEEINDLMNQRNILLVLAILQTTYLCFNC